MRRQRIGAAGTTREGCPESERGGDHPFGGSAKGIANFAWPRQESGFNHCIRRSLGEGGNLAPQTALRDSAFHQSEASPQVVSEAKDNMAGFVLANGPDTSGSSNQSGEGEPALRDRALIEANLVGCMVALPGQLFYSTQIPVYLWFLTKNKAADAKGHFRDRRKQPLFIDRVRRELQTLWAFLTQETTRNLAFPQTM